MVIKQNATKKTQLHAPLLYFLQNIRRQVFPDKKAALLSVLEKFTRIIVTPLDIRRSTSLFSLGLLLGTLVATSCRVVSTDATIALLVTAIFMLASDNGGLTQTNISTPQAALLSFQTCWIGLKVGTIPDACRAEESK